MKILFIIDALGSGGAQRQFMELTKRMPDLGVTPIICTLNKNKDEYKTFYSDKKIEHLAFKRKYSLDFSIVYSLVKICLNNNIDIIQTWLPLPGTYGLLVAKLTGTPLVCSSIRDARVKDSIIGTVSKNLQARFSDVFISNSKAGFSTQFKFWRNNFRVITNGIDLCRFNHLDQSKIAAIRETLSCEDTFNIGMCANLRDHRDPFTLIKAANLMKKAGKKFRVFIIGSGDQKNQAFQLINKLGLSDTVVMLGYKHDIEYYISVFDVSVLLVNAKTIGEGISNFLMESMALKKVVVATRTGGNMELIEDSVTGYLVDPYNERQLSEKLLYIKSHDQSKIVDNAYKHILETYDMEKYVKAYHDIYLNLKDE